MRKSRRRVWLAAVGLLIAALILGGPVLVGHGLRGQVEPLRQVAFAAGRQSGGPGAIVVRVVIEEAGVYATRLSVALSAPDLAAAGSVDVEHSPRTLLAGAGGWPGLLRASGQLVLSGPAVQARYRTPGLDVKVDLSAAAPLADQAQIALDIGPGELLLPGSAFAVKSLNLHVQAGPGGDEPIPFTIRVEAEDGILDGRGQAHQGVFRADAYIDGPLALAVSVAGLRSELAQRGSSAISTEGLSRLAQGRVDSLVALGLLRVDGQRLFTQIEVAEGRIAVFGAPLAPDFTLGSGPPSR